MTTAYFSPEESTEIREWFGAAPENLLEADFRKTLRELRAKFHPDNFEKFDDATVRQLATDRFQRIQRLAEKLEAWFQGSALPDAGNAPGARNADPILDPRARFAYQAMKIEIRTSDKDLKYHLFGTFYRWLTLGERFKIPETQAFLIADEDYSGRSIGFIETIRLYLTFEESDPVESIVGWLFPKIEGRADTLLIEGEIIPIEYGAILLAVKKRSFKALGAGA
ncbi:MAG: hypothetical protein IT260_09010 [Saprospiraceae bacterium]|nr:hypothetical protein [Saprospiraceae bacterium]